jgi:hypothetical protein
MHFSGSPSRLQCISVHTGPRSRLMVRHGVNSRVVLLKHDPIRIYIEFQVLYKGIVPRFSKHYNDGKLGLIESNTQIYWSSYELKNIGRDVVESNIFQLIARPINFVLDEIESNFCIIMF